MLDVIQFLRYSKESTLEPRMKQFPLIWPSGSAGVYIGNTRAILDSPEAVRTLVGNFVRVLIADDTEHGVNAALVCGSNSGWIPFHLLFPIGSQLSRQDADYFAQKILPWMERQWPMNLPLLIVSPHGVNRAPALAMTLIAQQVAKNPELSHESWEDIFGICGVELVTHACPFAAPTPELLGSLLESIGRPLPANYREIYEKVLKHH